MKKQYPSLIRVGTLSCLLSLLSCHQEPALPESLVPLGCRLGLVTNIFENYSDSSSFLYDAFGHVIQSSIVRREKGRIIRQTLSTFTYSDDHYLNNRIDRVTVVAFNGQVSNSTGAFMYEYEGTPKRIQAIRRASMVGIVEAPLGITYEYSGDQLTQYTEIDANGTTNYQAFLGADGRLNKIQRTNFQLVELANGLVSRTVSNKDTVKYSYDGQRQLVAQETSFGATGERVQRTITYDGQLPQRTGELRLPGFPTIDLKGMGQSKSNILTESNRRYRSNFLTETTVLRYSYAYNNQGYPTGYARSDGARAKFYYTNCP